MRVILIDVFTGVSPVRQATMDLELGGNIEGDADSSFDSDNDDENELMVDIEAGLHGNAIPEPIAQPSTTSMVQLATT